MNLAVKGQGAATGNFAQSFSDFSKLVLPSNWDFSRSQRWPSTILDLAKILVLSIVIVFLHSSEVSGPRNLTTRMLSPWWTAMYCQSSNRSLMPGQAFPASEMKIVLVVRYFRDKQVQLNINDNSGYLQLMLFAQDGSRCGFWTKSHSWQHTPTSTAGTETNRDRPSPRLLTTPAAVLSCCRQIFSWRRCTHRATKFSLSSSG